MQVLSKIFKQKTPNIGVFRAFDLKVQAFKIS